MSVKARTTGGFYSEEAARLMSEAAGVPRDGMADVESRTSMDAGGRPVTPLVQLDEPDRPPLRPRPAINQNAPADRAVRLRRRPVALKVIAWVVVLPLYVATAAAAIGLDLLFLKDLLLG